LIVGEGGGRAIGRMGPGNDIKLTTVQYRIQSTAAAKFLYIKLPMYLFFIWALGLADFDAGKSITFLGPPLQVALEMDFLPSKS
jgi:hypothetical protein